MNPPPLVLLAPRVTDDSIRIWKAAIDEGWSVQRLPSWRVPDELKDTNRDYVIYAEPLFAEAVADQMGMILLEPPPEWLPQLPERFRQRAIGLCSLAEARKITKPVFVKPAEGKVFEARVYSTGEALPSSDQVDDSLLVLTSEPVEWELEVRCFVRDGRVTTLSPYWRQNQLAQAADGSWPFLSGEEERARKFTEEVLATVKTPPAFVLDVGIISQHGWAVVEGNPCWGAGLYGCNPTDALQTARRAIGKPSTLPQQDRRWVSPRVRARLN